MTRGVLVTGTDTGIGKTFASAALLRALAGRGIRAGGMKPLASGCERQPEGWCNEDALALQAAAAVAAEYALVNPYALPLPTAPEIAAAEAGVEIRLDVIDDAYRELARRAELVVVEGVGGWLAPLSTTLWHADLARRLELPVLLVVGLRLGCINHALLTARAVEADGLRLLGWIGNSVDPAMQHVDETVRILRRRMPVPCLGLLPHAAAPAAADAALMPAVDLLQSVGS